MSEPRGVRSLRVGTAILAGAAYFSVVFAVGFALGTVRTLFVAPRVGDVGAVLIETPLILTASWIACGELVQRFQVPRLVSSRAAMGACALLLTLLAELALARLAFGRSLPEWLAGYRTMAGLIGLAAQIGFGALPLIRR